MAYADYLIWRADSDNDSSTDKKWASQWLRYFIYPVITANGSNNITVWGMMNVEDLENNSDTTIFSYSMPECNEAIVLEAGAILKAKGENEKSTEFKSLEAKQILALSFDKIKREQAKYEKTQPFLNVPNYYGKTIPEDEIGDF